MIQYPQNYEVEALAASGMASPWKTAARNPASAGAGLSCAIPPEFQGPGGGASPEDLYAMALVNCFVATFKVFAEKSRLEYRELECRGVLTVDRDEKGVPWMARIKIAATVSGGAAVGESRDRMLSLLEKTSRSCMILNSVKTEKTFEFGVRS